MNTICIFTMIIPLILFLKLSSSDDRTQFGLLNAHLASKNQFPFIVRIYLYLKSGKTFTCTGTIISEKFIFGSAYCAEQCYYFGCKRILYVYGDPDHSEFLLNGPDSCDKEDKKYYCYNSTSAPHGHNGYQLTTSRFDVAVFKLHKKLSEFFNHGIFDCSEIGYGSSTDCTIIGFVETPDKNGFGNKAHLYYKTGLKVDVCNDNGKDSLCIKGAHLCGDTGGPLICKGLLYGVASKVTKNCSDSSITYYAPLLPSIEWWRDVWFGYFPCNSGKIRKSEYFILLSCLCCVMYRRSI